METTVPKFEMECQDNEAEEQSTLHPVLNITDSSDSMMLQDREPIADLKQMQIPVLELLADCHQSRVSLSNEIPLFSSERAFKTDVDVQEYQRGGEYETDPTMLEFMRDQFLIGYAYSDEQAEDFALPNHDLLSFGDERRGSLRLQQLDDQETGICPGPVISVIDQTSPDAFNSEEAVLGKEMSVIHSCCLSNGSSDSSSYTSTFKPYNAADEHPNVSENYDSMSQWIAGFNFSSSVDHLYTSNVDRTWVPFLRVDNEEDAITFLEIQSLRFAVANGVDGFSQLTRSSGVLRGLQLILSWDVDKTITTYEVLTIHDAVMLSTCTSFRTCELVVLTERESLHLYPEQSKVTEKLKMLLHKVSEWIISHQDVDDAYNLCNFVAEFCMDFECLHPFEDGNRRVGRLLVYHLLRKVYPFPLVLWEICVPGSRLRLLKNIAQSY